jgi:aminopeptidase N
LLLHELTHQWFGDLTTMRWFDDLWLKEGFAQYMAYQTLVSLKPSEDIWKRFFESIKPAAYAIDSTKGTTAIYQDIPNLKDAKSAYGAIVYSKAPGVLKQLAFVLGPENFRDGLRLYLKEHAYSNAEWGDLVHAFEQVSGTPLGHWAEMWIRHRGMPQVDVAWSCDEGRLSRLSLSQHDVLGTSDIWPLATQVVLIYTEGEPLYIRVDLNQPTTAVPGAPGKPCPHFIFANDQDYAYGRFLLDMHSRENAMTHLGNMRDLFLRTLLCGSLWDSVRQADLAPRAYIHLAAQLLAAETDESLTQSILSRTAITLHRYVTDRARSQLVPALETMAADHMVRCSNQDLRIIWFRGLRALAETPEGRVKLKTLLRGRLSVPGVQLRSLDRWNLVSSLNAFGDAEADAIFNSERQRDQSGDGQKYAYVAEAARPDAQTKQKYFDDYLHNRARPEDWIAQSLGTFNYWNQSALTEPYLKPALEALPEIKRDRKIFFLVAWLNAFVEEQHSAAAQAQVYLYLQTTSLDKDLQLKVLQAVDELDRTVTIRRKFPE